MIIGEAAVESGRLIREILFAKIFASQFCQRFAKFFHRHAGQLHLRLGQHHLKSGTAHTCCDSGVHSSQNYKYNSRPPSGLGTRGVAILESYDLGSPQACKVWCTAYIYRRALYISLETGTRWHTVVKKGY